MKKPIAKKPAASAAPEKEEPFDYRKCARIFYGEGTFDEALMCLEVFGDKQPLVDYLASGKGLDAKMGVRLARAISGEHHSNLVTTSGVDYGPYDLVVQRRKNPPGRPSYTLEELSERYRKGAEAVYFRVRCKHEGLDSAILTECAARNLTESRLRKEVRQVEADWEDTLPRERGAYAQKKPKKPKLKKSQSRRLSG
jgi:hypothetical protein